MIGGGDMVEKAKQAMEAAKNPTVALLLLIAMVFGGGTGAVMFKAEPSEAWCKRVEALERENVEMRSKLTNIEELVRQQNAKLDKIETMLWEMHKGGK